MAPKTVKNDYVNGRNGITPGASHTPVILHVLMVVEACVSLLYWALPMGPIAYFARVISNQPCTTRVSAPMIVSLSQQRTQWDRAPRPAGCSIFVAPMTDMSRPSETMRTGCTSRNVHEHEKACGKACASAPRTQDWSESMHE